MSRDVFGWQISQLRRMRSDEMPRIHFNPKPAGSMRQGSYTHRVLDTLRSARGNWLSYGDLLAGMGEQKGRSIHWALYLLIERGDAECSNSDSRNPKYAMYRAKIKDQRHGEMK